MLRLDPFTMSEARDLLARRLGSGRVQREPQAADELIGCCARLPLALSVAAAYAAAHPDFPLEVLASEFRSRGLDLLDTGDPATTTRTVFSWSYHHLSEGAARMFRLLGIQPARISACPPPRASAAIPVEQARKALDELARAYLVEEHLPGRFAFHDLLHAYAAEQARTQENSDELDAGGAAAARSLPADDERRGMLLYSARLRIELPPPVPGVAAERFATHKQAMAWCRAERHVIHALVTQCCRAWRFRCLLLADPVGNGADAGARCLWHDYLASQRIALTAAQNLKDAVGLGHTHYEFAHACALLGEVADSGTHLEQALELFTELGDLAAVAMAQAGMAQLLEQQGQYTRGAGTREGGAAAAPRSG